MNLRFPGQYYDEETGTHYNFHRDYKPNQGRYVQSDPIRLEGGVNFVVYTENLPISVTDTLGLLVQWKGSIIGGGATAGVGGFFGWFDLDSECKCGKNII
ncbi:RHS repeat-associated core domain-containing protein [Comamonadaceae bacterium OH2545_COT-014]|nr:RHS repeat-associated core domain-containing protein [Comamonadaceae bacterium OH2545_COT-014]